MSYKFTINTVFAVAIHFVIKIMFVSVQSILLQSFIFIFMLLEAAKLSIAATFLMTKECHINLPLTQYLLLPYIL